MKISRNFKKMSKLTSKINAAKEEAKNMIGEIDNERVELDTLEKEIKTVIKL